MNLNTMNYKQFFFALTLFLLPSATYAFDVIDAQVTPLVNDSYLYTLTYEYGYLNGTTSLPMLPQSTSEFASTKPAISYTLTPEAPNSVHAGVVLTTDDKVLLEDGYYIVPEGERAQFTLVVLYKHGLSKVALPMLKIDNLTHTVETDTFKRAVSLTDQQEQEYTVSIE